ncbi:MAG: FMN-binding protein [Anaeromyxobacteraceae bacterium]
MRTRLAMAAALALLGASARADSPPLDPGPPRMLRATFPEAERFDSADVILTDDLARKIDELARSRIAERMVTFYTARRGADVLGYAVVQSHVVRTKRETLLVAFEPDGRIRRIAVVSFLEPPEYRPSERWLGQFAGKGAADRLAVGDDLAPISGSTLSARGVAEQSRWLLQALQVAKQQRRVP